MSLSRILPTAFVVLTLGLVIGAFGQPVTVQMPVCRVEVTWEGLETANVDRTSGRISTSSALMDLWLWGMAVAELPGGVQLPQNYQWDNQHKDTLSMVGPIDSYSVPTASNPWKPRSPVLLFGKTFTRSTELQIVTRTLNFVERYAGVSSDIFQLEDPGAQVRKETVTCPAAQETRSGTITMPGKGYHKYTYKITTTAVGSRNVPGATFKED